MPDLIYNKSTDQEHEIKLESSLISAGWNNTGAFAGGPAGFAVETAFVGEGATIKITGKSKNGKKLGKIDGEVRGNSFTGEFEIPDDVDEGDEIYFEYDLSKNGINGKSESIPVYPAPVLKKMKWSKDEARRGEVLKLTTEFEKVDDGAEAVLTIYEYDQDKAHDKITEMDVKVTGKKIEVDWEYEYHEDTDEIPTDEEKKRYGGNYNPPEYFFTVKIGEFVLGKNQESGLLKFKDWVEIVLNDNMGNPVPDEDYVLTLPDGSEKKGKLDKKGRAVEKGIPPGKINVEFPNRKGGVLSAAEDNSAQSQETNTSAGGSGGASQDSADSSTQDGAESGSGSGA